uniref:AMP-dependent synthetase/ligase domain-containing protein n=2 Tax=Lotharella globosa TaxID=91324 RepID=A0A7S4DTQ0_9EUKA|mmetsp:Transcript_1959/g.3860  ORF Transcript_1959/g.3860 Transcript_1959/m.3860 type:complete len:774 (+) Transcript_1959:31-2352(+)
MAVSMTTARAALTLASLLSATLVAGLPERTTSVGARTQRPHAAGALPPRGRGTASARLAFSPQRRRAVGLAGAARGLRAVQSSSAVAGSEGGAGHIATTGVDLARPQDRLEKLIVPTDMTALGDIWDHLKDKVPDKICLTDDYHGDKAEMTFKQVWEVINDFGAGLQKLDLKKGDKVALFSDNSHRWLIADNAVIRCGAASAVRGSTAPGEELAYIMGHSDSVGLIAENYKVYETLLEKDRGLVKSLKFIVILFPENDGDPPMPVSLDSEGPKVVTFQEVIDMGKTTTFQKPVVGLDDLASLIYTSGTTGKPKGVMLNHAQFIHQMLYNTMQTKPKGPIQFIKRLLYTSHPRPDDVFVSILPSWHIFERVAEYWILSRGARIVYSTIKQFRNDIQKWRPHYLVAVPRLYETIYQGAEKKFKAKASTAKLVGFFKKIGAKYLRARRNVQGFEGPTSLFSKIKSAITLLFTTPLYWISDKLVWSKIRNGLGGRVKVAISGGSALPMYVEDFFDLAQVPIIVGYGLTETTAPIANRLIQLNQRGTTGVPVSEIRIVHPETGAVLPPGEQGVVECRGNQVMAGYYKDIEATQKVMSKDGFFSTGDLGVINERGILKITGRQKDTIVLLNGENVEPQPIEEALVASPVIDQVMLAGQDANFLSALIVPSLDALLEEGAIDASDVTEINDLKENGDEEGLEALAAELSSRKAVELLVNNEMNLLNRAREGFRPDENVRKFRLVLSPFTMDNGLLTQTLKVKRNEVSKKYKSLLEEMYAR